MGVAIKSGCGLSKKISALTRGYFVPIPHFRNLAPMHESMVAGLCPVGGGDLQKVHFPPLTMHLIHSTMLCKIPNRAHLFLKGGGLGT